MLVRWLALFAAIVPPAAVWLLVGHDHAFAERPWLAPACAAPLAVLVAVLVRRQWLLLALGFVLTTAAGYAAARARTLTDVTATFASDAAWTFCDLTRESLPADPPRYLAVQGYFHPEWKIDEYAVPQGRRPDQSAPAEAVLVPFLGTREPLVTQSGAIVVARVEPDRRFEDAAVILRGEVKPIARELLLTLVQPEDEPSAAKLSGLLLDTLVRPESRDAWMSFATTFLALFLACVAYVWMAD